MKILLVILCIFSSLMAGSTEQFKQLYDKGEYAKVYQLASKDCSKEDPNACAWIGRLYQNGEGTTKDNSKAVFYYTKASDAGIGFAQNALGEMYYRGEGVGVDYQKAFSLISNACSKNVLTACESIAYLYEQGHGVQKNIDIAYQKYSQTCSAGLSTSCNHAQRLKLAREQEAQEEQLNIQREQLREQRAYQQEQLRIQQEQLRIQQEQLRLQQEQNDDIQRQNTINTWKQIGDKLRQSSYDQQQRFNQSQQQDNQFYQRIQLEKLNKNLNGLRYGY